MRWLSPPLSVPLARDSVRYSSPTSLRKVSRSRISLRMRAAISFCFAVSFSGSVSNQRSRLADRHLGDLADMQARDLHRQRLRLQAIAGARLAGLVGLVALQLLAHPVRFRLAPAPLDIGDDAFERLLGLVVAHAVVIDKIDFIQGAVEHDLAEVLRQVLPRLGHRLAVVLGQRLQGLLVIGRGGGGARPRRDGAARQRQVFVRHHQFRFEEQLGAEPVAFGAGAIRVVEREQPRLDLLDGEAGDRAGELRREDQPLGRALGAGTFGGRVGELGDGDSVRQVKCRFETVGEPCRHVGAHDDTVNDHVDIVFQLLIEGRGLGDLVEGVVDLDPLEALFLQLRQFLTVLAFAPAGDRRHEIEPRAFGQAERAVHHLANRLTLNGKSGRGRVGDADPRPQEPHVVVDLRDRADSRARVLRSRFLLDGNSRRESVDMIHVRLLHHVEELPGVSATSSPHSAAGPRHRSCRRRARTCRSRTAP